MGTIRVNGSTSGYVELSAPAVAGSTVLTLPATTGTVAVQGEAYGRSATATVATRQSTSTLTFTDLATAGPAVTVTTGTKALVIVGAYLYNVSTGGGGDMGYAVSGATTVAATQTTSLVTEGVSAGVFSIFAASRASYLTGLTAGANTFTAKYRATVAGAANYQDRQIIVIDMGS